MLDMDKCQGIDILIDKIKYFRLIGQKYVTTEITGGGSSLKGAVIGGMIAGDVGVVGSRKAVDEVKSTSTVHDEQVVLLYSSDLKQVITFNSNAYSILTKLIPEKEYEVVVQSGKEALTTNDSKSAADAVREYKKLLYEGIISTQEFEKKKKELLALQKKAVQQGANEHSKWYKKQRISNEEMITSIIQDNPHITAEEMVEKLFMTVNRVRYYIKKLKKEEKLIRVRSKKKGSWKVKA